MADRYPAEVTRVDPDGAQVFILPDDREAVPKELRAGIWLKNRWDTGSREVDIGTRGLLQRVYTMNSGWRWWFEARDVQRVTP